MKHLWIFLCLLAEGIIFTNGVDQVETWTGRWFPDVTTEHPVHSMDNGIPMGITNSDCDDAKTHLEVDWLDDPSEYTCYERVIKLSKKIRPLYSEQSIPPMYRAAHACMNQSLIYDDVIPTFGTHRPLWPVWGEYRFVPVQRWLHSLEHGAIVMLYHPCVGPDQVEVLRALLTGCLYRHIITPYVYLTADRPLALVAWGRSLEMSAISKEVVTSFIKENALRGPEQTWKQGQYSHALVKPSQIVSTQNDSALCPLF